jgi:hypothetical protein
MAEAIAAVGDKPQSKGLNIASWVAQVLGAVAFLGAGGSKLAGTAFMVTLFETIGIGQWFRYVTGTVEVVSAVLLLVLRLSGVGALLLCATMIGAIIAHLTVLHDPPIGPVILLLLCGFIAWARKDRTLALLGR